MSTQPLADVVTAIREMVGDLGGNREQTVRVETPTGTMDGVNKLFTLQYYPVNVSGFALYLDGVLLAGAGTDYTLTPSTGLITMVAAPTFANKLTASYTWIWFADERYYEFVYHAGQRVGTTAADHGSGTTAEDRATSTVLGMNDGLMDAFRLFASCEYCMRRATEAGHKVASSGGGQSISPQSITSQFDKLGKSFCDRAVKARDEFYERKGARQAPATAISKFDPILRWQPRR